jgi:putative ABC transport system permease protein
VAKKFFGDEDPIGKTITVNNQKDYTVTGVIADVPANSHMRFDFVRPFELFRESGRNLDSWGDVSFYTYVQLQRGSSVQAVNSKLKEMVERDDPAHNLYYLQPLTRIHLHSNFNFDFASHGNIIYVYIFAASALFILLIACINFMNLATARSGIRAKEVGMRKVVGAKKSDIIKQFYGEFVLSSLISLAIAIFLILLLLPAFNNLSGKELSFTLSDNTELILGFLVIAVFTGILSGSYPALFLSSFHPIKVIRGALQTGVRGANFRKILVVTQFSLTIILIIGTLVVFSQLKHIRSRNLGYNKEHLVVFALSGEMRGNFEPVKSELLRNGDIFGVTASSSLPTHIGSGTSGAWWEGKEEGVRIQMQVNSVDPDYLDTMKMEMAQGRFFSKEHPADNEAFVLNEAAVKAVGMESPLGKEFRAFGIKGPIIGIVKDFHYKSLHTEIEPLILLIVPRMHYYATVRINGENIKNALAFIEETWKKFIPGFPFEFSFLDDRIDSLYRAEQRMGKVFNTFTALAIFVACLGLFGMASFTVERRTKEIGIRKVLGASVPSVLVLLSKESTRLILISNLIAWPVAYYVMNRWLQGFVYRTNINIWIFFLSAATALLIALLTVSLQSLKAALANPAHSLRYE